MVNDGVEACRLYPGRPPLELLVVADGVAWFPVVITNPDQIPEVRNDNNEYTSSEWLTRTGERSLSYRMILILTLKFRGIHSIRIETRQCHPLQPSKRTDYR